MTCTKKFNGTVYALICKIDKKFYIGSTTIGIEKRLSNHRKSSANPQRNHSKIYKHMNDTGRDNWSIHALSTLPETTKSELEDLEYKYIHQCLVDENKKAKLLNTMVKKTLCTDAEKQHAKEYGVQKIFCDKCGRKSTKRNIAEHKRSKYCRTFVPTQTL